MTIPLSLTLSRILLIPLFVLFFYLPFVWSHYFAAAVFLLAAVTDWLDGYLARSLDQTSKLGAFLDPVADKLMVAVALVVIVGEPWSHYLVLPAAVIIGREILVSALREWMAELGKRASVAVSFISKIKTAIQMLAITMLLIAGPSSEYMLLWAGYVLLYIAVGLTIWTMVMYLKAAWPDLMAGRGY